MGVLENVKEVTGLIQKIDNIELYRKILDLQAEVFNLVDENRKLKQDSDELREKQRIKETLFFDKSVYVIQKADGKEEGPFCPSCWDGHKRLSRLAEYGNTAYLRCPVCDKAARTQRRPTS